MSSNVYPVLCTAGAIPYRNEKGEISMKNVKVSRYVAGKAPEFIGQEKIDDFSSQNYENDDEMEIELINDAFPDRNLISLKKNETENEEENENIDEEDTEINEIDLDDRRIQRLSKENRRFRVEMMDDSDSDREEDRVARHLRERQAEVQKEGEYSDEEEENEDDEEDVRQKRDYLRRKALENVCDDMPELMVVDEDEEEELAFSEEEESDSDNEREPKLKPVFVKAAARHTIHKTKEQILKEQEKEGVKMKHREEMVKQNRKMIDKINKEEAEESRKSEQASAAVSSDIENESEEYELWKMRELKRIKREREEKEQMRKDKEDVLRIRNMTEEQRLHEFKSNPKKIINQQPVGKLKFMQKYYHRGAFFVQELEDDVFKRDFTAPTLEDNFNIQNLPQIKQVKNFGRAGRTKYTHLVDQDTTDFDSGWANSNSTLKFYNNKAGGMKQIFEKPSSTKKK